ncbi:MAG: hypothetical protein IKZ07_04805 [Akkermansia sp.]|nr:hypothetical protein [Akkermansia sp.]
MAENGDNPRSWWHRLLSYVWGYMGTLSALGLLLGVLGMGVYHVFTPSFGGLPVRYFSGVYNTAGADAPFGVGEIYAPQEGVGVPHLRFEYGHGGQLSRLVYCNAEGMVSPMPGSRVAEQRLIYNKNGQIAERRNFDEFGNPVADSAGIAVREFKYDPAGRLVGRIFRNAHGQKIVPRMPGFAEERISYDDRGRMLKVEYLDGEEKPIVNAAGESRVVYTYNDRAQERLRTNYVKGVPTENADGVVTEQVRRTEDGLVNHTTWLDSAGKAVASADSVTTSMLVEQKPESGLLRTRFFGQDGRLRDRARVWSEHLVRSNPNGRVEWECFNGADGRPCLNPIYGYAERLCEYAPDGNLEREFFWDCRGNPADCYEKRHISDGSSHHVISLRRDGSTELTRTR